MSKLYQTDVDDTAWAIIEPHLPPTKPGGRPRSTDPRAVVNAIFYLLRTGCQWRLLPRCFPPWSTVHHYFRAWDRAGVMTFPALNYGGCLRRCAASARWQRRRVANIDGNEQCQSTNQHGCDRGKLRSLVVFCQLLLS